MSASSVSHAKRRADAEARGDCNVCAIRPARVRRTITFRLFRRHDAATSTERLGWRVGVLDGKRLKTCYDCSKSAGTRVKNTRAAKKGAR